MNLAVQAGPGIKGRACKKNDKSKKGWACDSSGRAPIWQAQSPEFKPQYHKKKDREKLSISICFYLLCFRLFTMIFNSILEELTKSFSSFLKAISLRYDLP
jgi:hypothetical protein